MSDASAKGGAPQQNVNAMKHGANHYLAHTAPGADGQIARDLATVESQVLADVTEVGPAGRVELQAVRFATAAELLWGHMLTSRTAFLQAFKMWGWLAGAEIRAWRDYNAITKNDSGGLTAEKILQGLTSGKE